mgnify:CR=1 FL=1
MQSESKKILHLITTADRGGAEIQVCMLAVAQKKAGHEVEICSLKGENELFKELNHHGVQLLKDFTNRNFFMQLLSFRRLIDSRNYDVIHAHLPRAEILTLAIKSTSKVLLTRHNSEKFVPWLPKILSNCISRMVISRADAITYISRGVAEYCQENGEIPKKAIQKVVYYGYERKNQKTSDSSSKSTSIERKRDSKINVLTIGRLVKQKDIGTQLRAIARLMDDNKDLQIELIIIGDGPLKSELVKEAQQLKIGDCVTFVGRVSNVYEFLDNADIFILSSEYEGFGLVILEALDSGVPIYASNIPTTREILGKDFEYLFEVGDDLELSQLLQYFVTYNQYDTSSYNSILKKFGLKLALENYDTLYTQLKMNSNEN